MKPILAAAIVLFLSCTESKNISPAGAVAAGMPGNLVLKSYDVPGDAAPQVRAILRELMWFGNDSKDSNKYVGRADVGVDGRLVVLAPPGVQEGIKGLIESVASRPPKPSPTVLVTYWVVLGAPGKTGTPSPALAEVAPALDEIMKTDGPQEFTLLEKLTSLGTSGESVGMKGRDMEERHTAAANAQGITADIHLERIGMRFDTRVKLQPDQLVVLASSGAAMKEKDAEPHSLYYLVRAAIHDGQGR